MRSLSAALKSGAMTRRRAVALALLLSCAGGDPPVVAPPAPAAVHAAAAVAPATSEPTATPRSVAAERLEVVADGHPITVWFKSAAVPRDAVVLVHGRTWSGRPDFDLQVPGEARSTMDALVAEGFAVYAVDQRGYGATPRDDTEWLTPNRAAEDLAAVLRWVGSRHATLARPTVLGWSLGSMVAQLTAQRHADLLSTLVLYGYPRDPAQTYSTDPPGRRPDRKPTTAKGAAEDFIVRGAASPATIEAFVAAAIAADPVRADWNSSEQWNALKPALVQVPTLLIHGERDPYAPQRKQAALFTHLGDADRAWVVLPGCDHAAHLERCGPRFVQAVVQFVRRPVAP